MLPRMVADGSGEAEVLAALARANLDQALTLLMRQHGRSLYQFCLSVVGDSALAEEVHQMTFVQAFEGLRAFAGRSSLKTWLFGIARHRCLDALKIGRRRERRFPLVAELPETSSSDGGADSQLVAVETRRALALCLDELPAKLRVALALRFEQNLSYPEIAAIAGERPATLQARVARSLPVLRRCLEAKGQSL